MKPDGTAEEPHTIQGEQRVRTDRQHTTASRLDARAIRQSHARVQIKQWPAVIKVECTLMYDMETRTTMRWTEPNSLDSPTASAGWSRGTKSHRLAMSAAHLLSASVRRRNAGAHGGKWTGIIAVMLDRVERAREAI
jgi:hypothetical protein